MERTPRLALRVIEYMEYPTGYLPALGLRLGIPISRAFRRRQFVVCNSNIFSLVLWRSSSNSVLETGLESKRPSASSKSMLRHEVCQSDYFCHCDNEQVSNNRSHSELTITSAARNIICVTTTITVLALVRRKHFGNARRPGRLAKSLSAATLAQRRPWAKVEGT